MKKNLFLFLILLVTFSNVGDVSGQTVIDYTTWTPNTNCNLFGTGPIINGLEHRTVLGKPTYEAVNKSIVLESDKDINNVTRGTSFRFNYNFKKGYTYKITIKASRFKGTSTSSDIRLRSELVNSSTTTTQCLGPEFNNNFGGSTSSSQFKDIDSQSDKDFIYNFNTIPNNFSYLIVGALIDINSTFQVAYIKKITIEETAPELVLEPKTLATTCGVSTAQTFSVGNPFGLEGISSYEWNLGSANNGWLYNGSPAPQNITTTSNSLALTSVCNAATVNNVGVTIKVNNANYKSYTATVSRAAATSPIIIGSSSICSGSGTYSISNLPCGATVNWSATGNTTFNGGNATGNSVTINNSGTEVITLTANISSACGNFTRTKSITVGLPPLSDGVTTVWDGPGDYVVGTNTPVIATLTNPYPNASYYSWILEPYPDAQTYINQGKPVPSGSVFNNGSQAVFDFDYPGDYMVTVKAFTDCGESNSINLFYLAVDTADYDWGYYTYSIYPNPANNELIVSYDTQQKNNKNNKSLSDLSNAINIRLVDDKGKVLREDKILQTEKTVSLNTETIPPGIYYLHILQSNRKIIKRQIVIKH